MDQHESSLILTQWSSSEGNLIDHIHKETKTSSCYSGGGKWRMMCKEFQKLNISSAFMNQFNFHHLKIKGAPLNVIWTSTFTRNSKSKSTYIVWSSPNRKRTHSEIFIVKKTGKEPWKGHFKSWAFLPHETSSILTQSIKSNQSNMP